MKERTETQIAIERQFMKQYKKNDYSKITVKELCAETPVARTTFYSYYQNIDEVKEEIENQLIDGLKMVAANCSKGCMESMDFEPFFDETILYLQNNWNEIYAFMISQPNIVFQYKWKNAIKVHFGLRYPQKKNVSNYELMLEVIASGVLGAYRYWLQNPDKVDPKKLSKVTSSALDGLSDII